MLPQSMNRERTASVFRYALAVAAREDDPFCRQLGPIHLLKYAYLVDLDYANHHGGETFTGIEWQFHNFGPWSAAAHALIAATMSAASIQERRIPSGYTDGDFLRWSMDPAVATSQNVGTDLPIEVRGTLETLVHKYSSDTSALLHYVYATPPMLRAAPGERLGFSSAPPQQVIPPETFVPLMDRLSRKQKKDFTARMSELRAAFDGRSTGVRRRDLVVRERLDSDFAETAAWVNSLAGPAFPAGEVRVEFDDSVWRSEARGGHGGG
jgi:hypothetical protein